MTVPGLARLASQELEVTLGATVTSVGFDGRADLLMLQAGPAHRADVLAARTVEDVFVQVGATSRAEGDVADQIAGRLLHPAQVERALSAWAALARPLASAMRYRVIVRVLQERSFLRTELRRAFHQVIGRQRPKWRVSDPAALEIWVCEHAPGQLVCGLRVSTAAMRQHGGRAAERPGALRPTVAAAMVGQAGVPGSALLDACCGSGTVLKEARAAGWCSLVGVDIDPGAVAVARRNVVGAAVTVGDARRLPLAAGSVDACVSNLPFGRQHRVQGDPAAWRAFVLSELARVTRVGGRIVLLAPRLRVAERSGRSTLARPGRSAGGFAPDLPDALALAGAEDLRLLGARTCLWTFDVVDRPPSPA